MTLKVFFFNFFDTGVTIGDYNGVGVTRNYWVSVSKFWLFRFFLSLKFSTFFFILWAWSYTKKDQEKRNKKYWVSFLKFWLLRFFFIFFFFFEFFQPSDLSNRVGWWYKKNGSGKKEQCRVTFFEILIFRCFFSSLKLSTFFFEFYE